MFTTHGSRTTMLGIAAVLSVVLVTPVEAQEKDHGRAMAPMSSVEARRVMAAQRALQAGDLGSMQEEALLAVVADGTSWDDMHGYGVVQASRVLAAQRVWESADLGSMQEETLTTMVPASGTAEQIRVLTAQQALQSPDLGSLQEEALTAIVDASRAEVER